MVKKNCIFSNDEVPFEMELKTYFLMNYFIISDCGYVDTGLCVISSTATKVLKIQLENMKVSISERLCIMEKTPPFQNEVCQGGDDIWAKEFK